jgi:hypothetical protein
MPERWPEVIALKTFYARSSGSCGTEPRLPHQSSNDDGMNRGPHLLRPPILVFGE